jgi:hypothetical protein
MKEQIKDYLKCVYANKVALTGYLALPVTFSLLTLGRHYDSRVLTALPVIPFLIAEVGLFTTSFGCDTFKTYRKTKKYIQKFGTIREDYRYLKNEWYCSRVAIRLAAKEAGLEHQLTK